MPVKTKSRLISALKGLGIQQIHFFTTYVCRIWAFAPTLFCWLWVQVLSSGLPRLPAPDFDYDESGDHQMLAINLACSTACVAFPELLCQLILSFRVMCGFTISTITIRISVSFFHFFYFPWPRKVLRLPGQFQSLWERSQRLLIPIA